MLDSLARPLRTLRLSITDRCNLRCRYCMPESDYRWLQRSDILSFEEILRVVGLLQGLGVSRVRLTGGEPLLRQGLPLLVRGLSRLGQKGLALTTNGILLAEHVEELRQAGIERLTVSLDSLEPHRFQQMAQRPGLEKVLSGLQRASQLAFPELKIDTVLLRGLNEEEIPHLVRFADSLGAEIRFIEYMDVGGATHWTPQQVVTQAEILRHLESSHGPLVPLPERGSAPAQRFRLASGQIIGVIASVTQPFCLACDRLRLTADGQLLTCLYARQGLDLRHWLRQGSCDDLLLERLRQTWQTRRDQAALKRKGLSQRAGYLSLAELQADPRLEMHTRGG